MPGGWENNPCKYYCTPSWQSFSCLLCHNSYHLLLSFNTNSVFLFLSVFCSNFEHLNDTCATAPTIMARPPKRPATTLDNDDVEHPYQESPLQKYRVGARSCRACHQRKVRCDRGVPCTNCSRCGITCMYPTKDREVTRKAPTLQTISNRLERLEVLLSRCLEGSQATTGPTADHGGVEPQTQIRVQNSVNVNTTRSTNQDSSNGLPCRSTWQLLLNDEPVSAKKSDEELLLQDVRLDFLGFPHALLLFFFLMMKPSYDEGPS